LASLNEREGKKAAILPHVDVKYKRYFSTIRACQRVSESEAFCRRAKMRLRCGPRTQDPSIARLEREFRGKGVSRGSIVVLHFDLTQSEAKLELVSYIPGQKSVSEKSAGSVDGFE
jgi:hypothetical protein